MFLFFHLVTDRLSLNCPLKLLSIALAIANFAATPNSHDIHLSLFRSNLIDKTKNLPDRSSMETEADLDLQQGIEHYQRGEFTEAIADWQRSLARNRTLGNRQNEAAALGNLGIAYRVLGDYVQAINYLTQALTIKREMGDKQAEGQLLVNLGNVYENLGEYDRTRSLYEQSLPILRDVGDRQSETIVLNNLGSLYANLNETDKAIANSEASLEIARKIGDRQGIGQSYLNLGLVYHTLGQIELAIDNYRQSLTLAKELDLPLLKIPVSSNLALAYEALNDDELAIEYHRYSLSIAREITAPREEAKVLNNFAHTLLKVDRLAEAETQLRRSIQLLDSLRKDLNDPQTVSIFDTQISTYNLLQQVLIKKNQPEAALEISEWGRSRAFTKLLIQRQNDRPLPESLLNPEPPNIDRIRQVARTQNATLVEYSIVPDDTFLHRGKLWGNKSDQLYIWVVQPTGKIDFRSVDLKPLTTPLETLVPDTRQTIGIRGIESPQKIVLVPGDFVRLNDDVPGWEPWEVLAVDEANGIVSLTQSSFPEGVSFDRPISDVIAVVDDRRTLNPQLQKLHQLLIEPIADLLPQNPDDHIIFIPHRELLVIPFAALQDTTGTYLIEQHTILAAPAIQILELTQKPSLIPSNQDEVLVVGNPTMPSITLTPGDPPQPLAPLPNAEREATKIAQIWQTEPFLGDQATKAEIVQKLPQAQFIHLATHGLLDDRSGMGSAIALAPTTNDDGWLTAKEILGLELHADLVVLSACNTGQGQITGDGVIGLSRSFLSAGAESVIVSLWMVPDAPTADLMTAFYQNLQTNPDRAGALRQAMLTTLERHPQPKNWAAFILMGTSH